VKYHDQIRGRWVDNVKSICTMVCTPPTANPLSGNCNILPIRSVSFSTDAAWPAEHLSIVLKRSLLRLMLLSVQGSNSQAAWHGGTVVSTAASQRQVPGFNSRLGSLSVRSLHILPMSAWVSSGCTGFLPHSRDVRVRLIGHNKLSLSVRGTS